MSHPFLLHYRGKRCGGCNLPFATAEEAVQYADESKACTFQIDNRHGGVVVHGNRLDARYKFAIRRPGDFFRD